MSSALQGVSDMQKYCESRSQKYAILNVVFGSVAHNLWVSVYWVESASEGGKLSGYLYIR